MDGTEQAPEVAPTMLCEQCWGVITPAQRCWVNLKFSAHEHGVKCDETYVHEACR